MAAALLHSDRVYFELGARSLSVEGATIWSMPGLEAVPGSCVVQCPERLPGAGRAARWLAEVTAGLERLGCAMARIYVSESPSPLDGALEAAGFRCRTETGYLSGPDLADAGRFRNDVVLRPVSDDDAWELKHKLHAQSEVASDGHATPAGAWVELERRKCETGQMQAFLIEAGGETCGSVATLRIGPLLRAKNIFVHPDRQREGIASAAMHVLCRMGQDAGAAATGIFGVTGNPGDALYRRLGMHPAAQQFEWSRPLEPAGGGR